MRVGLVSADARQAAVKDAFIARGVDARWLSPGDPLPELTVLPMPVSEDGVHMFGSNDRLEDWWQYLQGRTVYGGRISDSVRQSAAPYRVRLHDHFAREEEAVLNVIPTVEGALTLAMEHTSFTMHGCRALVCGFGRIGKLLAHHLQALGAEVYVSARKPGDLAWCTALGYIPCHTRELAAILPHRELIFNTVPHLLFDRATLHQLQDTALLIDLASKPGGVDFDYAATCGKHVMQALALPGKVAPRTAGEIICKTILGMYKEENTLGR